MVDAGGCGGLARVRQAVVLGVLAAVWWPHVAASQVRPDSACYRVEGGRVLLHHESFDPQFRRTRVVERVLAGADAETFEELEGPKYACSARDRNRVYWHTQVIEGADPASFRWVGGGYAVDRSRIYYHGSAVAGADRATFEWFGFDEGREPFVDARDEKRIYRKGAPLKRVTARPDAASFRALDRNFFVDKERVYRVRWARQIRDNDLVPVPEADRASFRLIGQEHGSFARDDRRVYVYSPNGRRYRVIEPAEIDSFVVLNRHYAKDSRRAYFQGEPLEGVDLATFEADGAAQARDRNRGYDARGRPRAVAGPARSNG